MDRSWKFEVDLILFPSETFDSALVKLVPALAANSHLLRGPRVTRASFTVSFPTVAIVGTGVLLKMQAVRASLSEHAFRSGATSLA